MANGEWPKSPLGQEFNDSSPIFTILRGNFKAALGANRVPLTDAAAFLFAANSVRKDIYQNPRIEKSEIGEMLLTHGPLEKEFYVALFTILKELGLKKEDAAGDVSVYLSRGSSFSQPMSMYDREKAGLLAMSVLDDVFK